MKNIQPHEISGHGWPQRPARQILRESHRMQLRFTCAQAKSGSIYLSGLVGGEDVVIRVSDHKAASTSTATISCDIYSNTVRQIIIWLSEKSGVPVPKGILKKWKCATRRNRRQRKLSKSCRASDS